MASSLQGALVAPRVSAAGRYRLLDKYFYFAMSLLIAAIVVAGFSRTVNQNLFHPAVPRPFLLWIHAAAFTLWVVFFILQSALVRVRKISGMSSSAGSAPGSPPSWCRWASDHRHHHGPFQQARHARCSSANTFLQYSVRRHGDLLRPCRPRHLLAPEA